MMMIPSRLAIRLCDDGWWVRSDIVWAKAAPMPESCTDRPTSAWEHVFLLTKSAKYFYDQEAVKIPYSREWGENNGGSWAHPDNQPKGSKAGHHSGKYPMPGSGANLRNFWLLGPEPFPESHFAVFPTRIPEICIKAGTSEKGVCGKCGAPWTRQVNKQQPPPDIRNRGAGSKHSRQTVSGQKLQDWYDDHPAETIGWQPTCQCQAGDPVLATCLDPFAGAGTTLLVADRLQRNAIGIELNPKYAEMAERRLRADAGMFAECLRDAPG